MEYQGDNLRSAIERLANLKATDSFGNNQLLSEMEQCHSVLSEWVESEEREDSVHARLVDIVTTTRQSLEMMSGMSYADDPEGYEASFNSLLGEIRGLLYAIDEVRNYQWVVEYQVALKGQLKKFGLSALKKMAYQDISDYLSQRIQYSSYTDTYISELIKHINVFGMTCTSKQAIINERLGINLDLTDISADVVILDEVSKIPFAQMLQPLSHAMKIILVGDHKQLPPLYTPDMKDPSWEQSMEFREKENSFVKLFDYPYFKTLFDNVDESHKTMLRTQYRMHRQIMDADNQFYDGALRCGANDEDKSHYLEVEYQGRTIIRPENHILFIDHRGSEGKSKDSPSMHNLREVSIVKTLVNSINYHCKRDREGKPLKRDYPHGRDTRLSVGVITPYRDQADKILAACASSYPRFNGEEDQTFEVRTVDDFQGDERDIIIISMVRSKPYSKFLMDFRRVNVAISRARRLLIIVGNAKSLEKTLIRLNPEL